MITTFRGQYSWLSNFSKCEVSWKDRKYPSVEHAYQAAKGTDSNVEWFKFCQETIKPGKVKVASRKLKLRPNWNNIKDFVMFQLLQQKYSQQPFRQKLIETKGLEIKEYNRWNDTYWGVCEKTGKGENTLGKMTMAIRESLLSLK